MRTIILAALLALATQFAWAQTACLDCHDPEEGGPIHELQQTMHGKLPQSCQACHGPSAEHMLKPTISSPDVSFGPRWTANTAEQDGSCLNCHKSNVAKHWVDSLHMVKNVTCASCHNPHDASQDLSKAAQQLDTCTTCHKTQKTGIHGKAKMARMNPPCTQCHNPHADQSPVSVMLDNDSQGCRRCHNLEAMAKSDKVSDKAKGYHRVMSTGERICVDCHEGVAHGDANVVEAFAPQPQQEAELTLFNPGRSDSEWLITEHPGSQPLRQGSNCRQCHRGEEAAMGEAMGGTAPTSRPVTVSFEADDYDLVARLSWYGTADDTSVSFMWDFGNVSTFQRGGCWAACHNDMAGMTQDTGTGVGKYLWSSLEQRRSPGRQAIVKSSEALAQIVENGDFAELWRLDLARGRAQVGTLLNGIDWLEGPSLNARSEFKNGRWEAVIRRPIDPGPPLVLLDNTRRYTFGMALHSRANRGAHHWVSLPMTVSETRDDTDFVAR